MIIFGHGGKVWVAGVTVGEPYTGWVRFPPRHEASELVGEFLRSDENGPLWQPLNKTITATQIDSIPPFQAKQIVRFIESK
jgi:hypothetical protein